MARSVVGRAVVVRQKFVWPDAQLNFWTLIMLLSGSLELGVFAQFLSIQNQMKLPSPWIFSFGVTVGALTVVLILLQLVLIAQRRLLPGIMLMAAFMLLVLFFTGMVATGIQLFSKPANVSNQCQLYVDSNKSYGATMETLAWLEQNTICSCWRASFAFWVIGTVFSIWMLLMSFQVSQSQFE